MAKPSSAVLAKLRAFVAGLSPAQRIELAETLSYENTAEALLFVLESGLARDKAEIREEREVDFPISLGGPPRRAIIHLKERLDRCRHQKSAEPYSRFSLTCPPISASGCGRSSKPVNRR